MATDAKKNKIDPPVFEEVAAAGSATTAPVLFTEADMQATPQNIKTWRAMLRDHQVSSTWQQRQLALLATNWEVTPGGDDPASQAAADFIKEQVDGVRFDAAFQKMHFGFFYGFSIAEMLYCRDGSKIALDDIKVRLPERFKHDPKTGELKFLSGASPSGESLLPNKYWFFASPGDSDDAPHGPPIGWRLYWPLFLKKQGAAFWAVHLEKYGMPTAVGTHPAGSSKSDVDKLLETLMAIHGNAAVALPEGFKAEFLEAVRTSGGDFENFAKYWDKAVSKIILSQTMTTDDGSSKSQAEVHNTVLEGVVQADADLLCESFNQGPIKWMTAWNFPGAKTPTLSRKIAREEDLGKRAERDKKLAEASGLRPTASYIEEEYGGKWEQPPSPNGRAPAPNDADETAEETSFTDPVADVVNLAAQQLDNLTSPIMDDIIDGVRDLIATSPSLEVAQERILAFAAQHDHTRLADMLAGGLSVSELQGRDDVATESNG